MTSKNIFKEEIQPIFERTREEYLSLARKAALKLGKKGPVTIDDVRAEVGPPPADTDPRVNGAVFSGPDWKILSYRKSGRRTCHNRPISVWVRT